MAEFVHVHGRHTIWFSDHALDRWWERCEGNGLHGRQAALALLRQRLDEVAQDPRRSYADLAPAWNRLSLFHRARANGYLLMGPRACFVVNRNATGDLVAVTYLDQDNFSADDDVGDRRRAA